MKLTQLQLAIIIIVIGGGITMLYQKYNKDPEQNKKLLHDNRGPIVVSIVLLLGCLYYYLFKRGDPLEFPRFNKVSDKLYESQFYDP